MQDINKSNEGILDGDSAGHIQDVRDVGANDMKQILREQNPREEMYENKTTPQRVLLAGADCGKYDAEVSMRELAELAEAAGAEVCGTVLQKLSSPLAASYLGAGKLEEIASFIKQHEIDLLIMDDELSGIQLRNIEKVINVPVVDRTLLILDIFASRARSNEGKLQVELARQRYRLPRLVGLGGQLSKQQGGIGSRGSGESQLEYDRRHIRRRIAALEAELELLSTRRARTRERRKKNDIPSIAIVGYTNVGKSTLLNKLTDAGVLAQDMLFATLDPTSRGITLEDGQTAMLIDTVGLLRRLPHQLIKAFRSTLEEAAQADVILQLCDISSGETAEQLSVTRELLGELGCGDIPTITVYNKVDLIGADALHPMGSDSVCISAQSGTGLSELLSKLTSILSASMCRISILLPYAQTGLMELIRQNGRVLSEEYENDGIKAEAVLERRYFHKFEEFII